MRDKNKIAAEEVETLSSRFSRYAAIQERLISPEGTYPAIGRSIAYRMGAFQHLSQAALQAGSYRLSRVPFGKKVS